MTEVGATWPAAGRLAVRLAALRGWRRFAVAFLLGCLSALAFAPLYLVPLLVPAFVGLLWMLSGAPRGRAAFAIGWAFGVGHFLVGLYWVGIAMTVDFASFWWFLPIAVGGLSTGMALYTGLTTWLLHVTRLRGVERVIALATLWLFFEWVRSWFLTGFPWNQLGSIWAFSPDMIQLASLTGTWGLTQLTVFVATAPALLGEGGQPHRRVWCSQVVAALLLLLCLFFGVVRLSAAPDPRETKGEPIARIVQPSIAQELKWRNDLRIEHVRKLMELTRAPGLEEVDLVIWPETAVPYDISHEPELRAALAGVVPPGGVLITGAGRSERGKGFWNSLYVLDATGQVLAIYDKAHLVPFGEYTPLAETLGSLNISITRGAFTPGPGPTTLTLPGLPPFSPLICYEVIFPGAITGPEGPQFLLNITNDAWFGRSSGPYQHLAAARLRAVEEGLPLLRAANNGISAVIDPFGRITGEIEQDAIGSLDRPIPASLSTPTLFATLGNGVVVPLILVAFVAGALTTRARRKQ